MAHRSFRDLIIIGAGPAGLRSAELAQKAGLDYIVLERGRVGQHWRELRPHMRLLSSCLPQRDWTSISPGFPIWKLPVKRPYCSVREFVDYLDQLRNHFNFEVYENSEVERVFFNNPVFRIVERSGREWETNNLLIATGIMNGLHFPDVPGIKDNPIVSHSQQFKSAKDFKGQRVLIIGSGNSAAETAIELAGSAMVYLYSRHEIRYFSETDRLYHVRGISESYLKELIRMEIIRHKPNIKLKEIKGNRVLFEDAELEVDKIIFATGYRPVLPFLNGLDLRKTAGGYPQIDNIGQSENYPGLFFTGPLARFNMASALIHGFSQQVEPTVKYIANRISKQAASLETEVQPNLVNLIM